MNVVFAGTPDFARSALVALHEAGHRIPLVLTQPDRPAGRGMKLQASPVKQAALALGATVIQPRSLRLDGKYPAEAEAAHAALQAAAPDVMVVAAYGLLLPPWVLALPRLGCLNIHASLLPRWRGAAPIHRAIEAGDAETGITIMQMDAGLDTGDMLLTERLPIAADATTGSLHDALAAQGAQLIVRALARLDGGTLPATPQAAEGVSYAHKIDKAEAAIDWTQPADVIERRIRAFNPFPGAYTQVDGVVLKVFRSHIDSGRGPVHQGPGQIVYTDARGIRVVCGDARVLCLTEVQRAGGKRMAAAELLRGSPMDAGQRLG